MLRQAHCSHRHPKGTQVPLTTVVQYAKDITSALQYAHGLRIIHRDVKPGNILVGRFGEVLLSDFGIAMLSKTGRTSLDVGNHKAGTPYYMAPEIIKAGGRRKRVISTLWVLWCMNCCVERHHSQKVISTSWVCSI